MVLNRAYFRIGLKVCQQGHVTYDTKLYKRRWRRNGATAAPRQNIVHINDAHNLNPYCNVINGAAMWTYISICSG